MDLWWDIWTAFWLEEGEFEHKFFKNLKYTSGVAWGKGWGMLKHRSDWYINSKEICFGRKQNSSRKLSEDFTRDLIWFRIIFQTFRTYLVLSTVIFAGPFQISSPEFEGLLSSTPFDDPVAAASAICYSLSYHISKSKCFNLITDSCYLE